MVNDDINRPKHYTQGTVECISAIESAISGLPAFEAYCVGNIIKYVWRYSRKGELDSLEKATWYLDKLKDTVMSRLGK